MTDQDKLFYRELYKALSDNKINDLLVKYAQIEHNKAVKQVRTKQDTYDYGYYNGKSDAWASIIQLKHNVTQIMKNIG